MKESPVKQLVLKEINSTKHMRLFRNNVGTAYQGKVKINQRYRMAIIEKFRLIKFGLVEGSGDLIGWKTVEITPDMIGQNVAVFLSVETKRLTGGKKSQEQKIWADAVNNAGGIAVFINDPEQCKSL